MRIITRKKPAFTDLYQTGVLTRIAAVKTDSGGWRCLECGVIRISLYLWKRRAAASGNGPA